MKILLVYPKYPNTFWSFNHALKFTPKKAAFAPLGLLTVAAMLPAEWEKRLVDMNTGPLRDEDIEWANAVFISAMITQKDSAEKVIKRCNQLHTTVVAGGPVFTTGYEEFEGVDHFVLGEAEVTLPLFLDDLRRGCPQPLYSSDVRPDITQTPVPLWELVNVRHYAAMPVQYSRGCPHDCEFCDIVVMNGRRPRIKKTSQVLREISAIYRTGFRGRLFVVDDNFIGNKAGVKQLLPKIIRWQRKAGYPFRLGTEASINLADDEELMTLMVKAGFDSVFVGLETPAEESLAECNKFQNQKRDMAAAVKKIQNHGMQVQGGFIVGFDSDPPSIFDNQINFIQKLGVVTAMVGILTALPKTKLHHRLKAEGRLIEASSGNNVDISVNFIPKMDTAVLREGYLKIIQTIYSPKNYYERIITFLDEYQPVGKTRTPRLWELKSLSKSIWHLGIVGKPRRHYWKFMTTVILKYHRSFTTAMELAIFGIHYKKICEEITSQSKACK